MGAHPIPMLREGLLPASPALGTPGRLLPIRYHTRSINVYDFCGFCGFCGRKFLLACFQAHPLLQNSAKSRQLSLSSRPRPFLIVRTAALCETPPLQLGRELGKAH